MDMRNKKRHKRAIHALALSAALCLTASACAEGTEPSEPDSTQTSVDDSAPYERGPVKITAAYSTDSGIELAIDSCNGEPEVDVTETDSEIRITVISEVQPVGDSCLDNVDVTLDTAVAGRPIIDEFDQQEVPVSSTR